MAETAGIAVLDADYPKGPEHVFPAAVNDAEDALRWVIGNPQRFDQDLILLGGSAPGPTSLS
jgi:acetyl esterase/lipase